MADQNRKTDKISDPGRSPSPMAWEARGESARTAARPGWRQSLGAVLAVAVAITLTPSVAFAYVSHAYTSSIVGSGTAALSGPTDVEVDQATHDIYVTDPGNHRIEKFDSSGQFLLMFGGDVDETTGGNVCPEHPGDVCKTGTAGSNPGQFEDPAYLAVDNSGGPSEGDVYVGDVGDNLVQKFDSFGHLVTNWGVGGQKNGSDITGNTTHSFSSLHDLAVASTNGYLYVLGNSVYQYTQAGTYIKWYVGELNGGGQADYIKADTQRNEYLYMGGGTELYLGVPEFLCTEGECQDLNWYPYSIGAPLTGFALDPTEPDLYQDTGTLIDHFSNCDPMAGSVCKPEDSFGGGHLFGSMGVAVDGESHAVYLANSTTNEVAVFDDTQPIVTTGPPREASETSVTITGTVNPAGRGAVTSCYFEYGFETSYGNTVNCNPEASAPNPITGETTVTATLLNLPPGTRDHYRLVATSAESIGRGADETFETTLAPSIVGLEAGHLAATSAELKGIINPDGAKTTYRFEYGPTTSYGTSVPVPDGTLVNNHGEEVLSGNQQVFADLTNLTPHIVYHYRLVATNADGTTETGDQTFNFYPVSCPNENIRQQTHANYLPDCRAYELVSPGDAGGTQLYPAGPNSGLASDPPRLAFTGDFGSIPGAGGSPLDLAGDLYVATRTDSGWDTRYVGMSSSEAAIDGGPAEGPPYVVNGGVGPVSAMDGILTDAAMNKFLVFNDGNPSAGSGAGADLEDKGPMASNAPFVYASTGSELDRWPTNLATVPDGIHSHVRGEDQREFSEPPTLIEPGGTHALDCPPVLETGGFNGDVTWNWCPGDVAASSEDLSHFVFASEWNVFAPEGQLSAPGSVYDNKTTTGEVEVASKTASGLPIPEQPTDGAEDPLRIPKLSADGSHILMAAGGIGPCGHYGCPAPPCQQSFSAAVPCPLQPSHLYMRVDDSITYDVSQGHVVTYVGMTSDGSKVFFTSEEQLTPNDLDSSVDMYMWSEAGEREGKPLTLLSIGQHGEGNSDECHSSFTSKCGVLPYSQAPACQEGGALNGNCLSDSGIASESGDVYFFSPEHLDGSRGIANQENLYVYRNGHVQYVTTLTGPHSCFKELFECLPSATGAVRMEVTPDGRHMAFTTASQITPYDNAGHLEMYEYEPETRNLVCVSCIPGGEAPTSDVEGSQDGLFLTDDGRVFFSTEDSLVPKDTNRAQDVYEYSEGHAQLITPGTGATRAPKGEIEGGPGLDGVSAHGTDVYFSTFDTLVPQDHNGLFLKFYDARSGGGFPAPPNNPPCEAAEECAGAGSSPPEEAQNHTGSLLGEGGNIKPEHKSRKHKRSRHRRRHRRRARQGRHHKRAKQADRRGSAGR